MSFKQSLGLILIPIVVVSLYFVLGWPPRPGDQPSPKLVEMFNREIDAELARIAAPPSLYSLPPHYRRDAADSARRWLSELREVVTHCESHSTILATRHNDHVFDATLQSGEKISGKALSWGSVSIDGRCRPGSITPMRVTFEGGRVIQVTTDGSEQTRSLESARETVEGFVRGLVWYDERRNPERYVEVQQKPDYAKEWAAP